MPNPFVKNDPRIHRGGRPKGTPNKDKAVATAMLNYLVDGGYSKFKEEFDKLEGIEYVKVFLRLASIMTCDRNLVQANEKLFELFKEKVKSHKTDK
jgi:hypothetical protein